MKVKIERHYNRYDGYYFKLTLHNGDKGIIEGNQAGIWTQEIEDKAVNVLMKTYDVSRNKIEFFSL